MNNSSNNNSLALYYYKHRQRQNGEGSEEHLSGAHSLRNVFLVIFKDNTMA